MKILKFGVIMMVLLGTVVYGQTITKKSMAMVPGTKNHIMVIYDESINIDLSASQWDFSSYSGEIEYSGEFVTKDETPISDSLPEANLFNKTIVYDEELQTDTSYMWGGLKITDSDISVMGYIMTNTYTEDPPYVASHYDDPERIIIFPLTETSEYSDTYKRSFEAESEYNGAKIKVSTLMEGETIFKVVGKGNISTPFYNNEPCLLEKMVEQGKDSTVMTMGGITLDPTVNYDTSVTYRWISPNYGVIATVDISPEYAGSDPINAVEIDFFRIDKGATSVTESAFNQDNQKNSISSASVFPNPMKDHCAFQFTSTENTKGNLRIYNINGSLIKSFDLNNIKKGLNTIRWNGENANGAETASGIYLYRVNTANSSTSGTLIKVK